MKAPINDDDDDQLRNQVDPGLIQVQKSNRNYEIYLYIKFKFEIKNKSCRTIAVNQNFFD